MTDTPYVSRGGHKLRHALTEFGINPHGLVCADLGCSTGGFTDCLLRAGAAKVYAVDTAYGELAWKLRKDPRVVVMERTNALHAAPAQAVDLVVVDLGWTPQRSLIPVALKWLKTVPRDVRESSPCEGVRTTADVERSGTCWLNAANPRHEVPAIITLIKPHYEAGHTSLASQARQHRGILPDDLAEHVMREVLTQIESLGVQVLGLTRSPLRGGSRADGNLEWLARLEPAR